MNGILLERRIRLWELVSQHYTIPKHRNLDKLIRAGEDIPPVKKAGRPKS
jgi:hypothetical protein